MLLIGRVKEEPLDCRACELSGGRVGFASGVEGNLAGKSVWGISGVAGADSPRTAVVGRKREAMTTRWFLRLVIVLNNEGVHNPRVDIYRRHGAAISGHRRPSIMLRGFSARPDPELAPANVRLRSFPPEHAPHRMELVVVNVHHL